MRELLANKALEAIALVEPYYRVGEACDEIEVDGKVVKIRQEGVMPKKIVDDFRQLAVEIYFLASKSGLLEHLPDRTRGSLTKLNLQGHWMSDSDEADSDGSYMAYPVSSWLDQMQALARTAGEKSLPRERRIPGPKGSAENDQRIANEFYQGLEDGLWETQAEYLRLRHRVKWGEGSGAAKSWLSKLLERVAARNQSTNQSN